MSQSSALTPVCESDVEIAANRWTAHMLRGDFALAWRESDFIRASGYPDPHRYWDGQSVSGRRVVLRCLHGLGDAVQLLRYTPQLTALAKSLVVEVPPRMAVLAPLLAGVENITTWNSPPPRDAWDCQIEVMELPYLFRTVISDLPILENYLRIPSDLQFDIARRIGERRRPRVGLVWAAGEWNPGRSLPFSLLRSLLLDCDCEFWNLQGGCAADDWKALPRTDRFRDARELGFGIMPLAACIQRMDLVVTVDTLAAHLAGAMGKSAWLLLTKQADWRWMTDRGDSPWYPSLRLFRQATPSDWEEVISAVRSELHEWSRNTRLESMVSR